MLSLISPHNACSAVLSSLPSSSLLVALSLYFPSFSFSFPLSSSPKSHPTLVFLSPLPVPSSQPPPSTPTPTLPSFSPAQTPEQIAFREKLEAAAAAKEYARMIRNVTPEVQGGGGVRRGGGEEGRGCVKRRQ